MAAFVRMTTHHRVSSSALQKSCANPNNISNTPKLVNVNQYKEKIIMQIMYITFYKNNITNFSKNVHLIKIGLYDMYNGIIIMMLHKKAFYCRTFGIYLLYMLKIE